MGTIQNDDLPLLSVDDVSVDEGNTETNSFSIVVRLSAPAQEPVTFDIATQDGTATVAEDDYLPHSLMKQTILAGEQIYRFELTIIGDTNVEANETFFVNVTNVNGAVVQKGRGTVTIPNDDFPPVVISEFRTRGSNGGNDEFVRVVLEGAPQE